MLTRFFAWLLHLIKCLLNWFGHGKEPRPRKATLAVTVEDLTVPLSGPKGPVYGAEFSLVGEFDVDYLQKTAGQPGGFAGRVQNRACNESAQ
jgi:hypothetical protein